MLSKDPLFLLVQRLTQHEKRYLKIFLFQPAKENPSHMFTLFQMLCEAREYNEKALQKSLGNHPLAQQWAVYKNLTFQNILRGLQAYRYENSPKRQIRSGLDKVEILMEKGQMEAALKMVKRTRAIGETYSVHEGMAELVQLERKIYRQAFPLRLMLELPRIEAYERKLNSLISQSAEAVQLHDQLFAWVQADRRMEKTSLAAQLNEVAERLERLDGIALPDFSTQTAILSSKALLRQLQGDYKGMRLAYTEILYQWEANPKIRAAEPQRHQRMQVAWLNSLLAAGEIGPHLPQIRALRRIPIQGEAESARLVFQSYNLELLWLQNQKNRAEALKFLATFEQKLEELKPFLDALRLASFCMNGAILCFQAQQYHTALKWLTRMAQNAQKETENAMHRSGKMLALVCQMELGQLENVEHTLHALHRQLKAKDNDWSFGNKVIPVLGKIYQEWGLSTHPTNMAELANQLEEMQKESQPSPFILDLLLEWAKSH